MRVPCCVDRSPEAPSMASPSITDPQDEAEEPVDAEPEPVAGNICEIIF